MWFSPNQNINVDYKVVSTASKQIRGKYSGGRFAYKKWSQDTDGNRIAIPCYREGSPDLQSTYLYNQDGSEVLRYIRLDIDADKSLPQWKDDTGAVDWFKIAGEMRQNFPGILRQIECVTRSTSKKGIHILLGIAPLPLNDKTLKPQWLARKIQTDLINIFNEIGVGADQAAKGLKQDFSTYRNTENVIHKNAIYTKHIEFSAKQFGSSVREKFLNNLNKSCENALIKLEIKNGYRLYPDMRLEPKIARLFLFTMGLYQPKEITSNIDAKPFYANLNSINLSLDQIAEIMETEKRYIYKQFWEKEEIKRLFDVQKNIDGTLTITVRDAKNIGKRIQRARSIWNYQPVDFHLKLIPPELVGDGFRNTAIVSWAISLKWHGVSEQEAFLWLMELVKRVPGYESSSSCKKKQIRSTVQSVYRNRRETKGILFSNASIPEWLIPPKNMPDERAKKLGNMSTLNHSRSIPFRGAASVACSALSSFINRDDILQPLSESQKFSLQDISLAQNYSFSVQHHLIIPTTNKKKSDNSKEKLRIVHYNRRVGFYLKGELLLCLIRNRHYKLTHALRYLENKVLNNEYMFDVFKDIIHVKYNAKSYKDMALALYHDSTPVMFAQQVCGFKKRYSESMEIHDTQRAEKECITLEEYRKRFEKQNSINSVLFNEIDVPF